MTFVPDEHDVVHGTWRPIGDQERTSMARFVAPGTETGGEFGMFEGVLAPGMGAVPHVHTGFSESFYVVEGSLRIRAGDDVRIARAGDFVYVPRGGVHAFRNDGADDTRFLLIFAPGAPREAYFRAIAQLGARETPPTPEEVDAVAARHDQVNLRSSRWALD